MTISKTTSNRIAKSRTAPKGTFVGVFNEAEIRAGVDIYQAGIASAKTGLLFMNTRFVKEGLAVWVCSPEECEDFNKQ